MHRSNYQVVARNHRVATGGSGHRGSFLVRFPFEIYKDGTCADWAPTRTAYQRRVKEELREASLDCGLLRFDGGV